MPNARKTTAFVDGTIEKIKQSNTILNITIVCDGNTYEHAVFADAIDQKSLKEGDCVRVEVTDGGARVLAVQGLKPSTN